jgi:hypothetical protein
MLNRMCLILYGVITFSGTTIPVLAQGNQRPLSDFITLKARVCALLRQPPTYLAGQQVPIRQMATQT